MKYTTILLALVCVVLCTEPSSAQTGQCPSNYELVGKSCYHFFNTLFMDYSSAKSMCEDIAGDLAILNDCEDFEDLVEYIYTNNYEVTEGYWIGGSDVLEEGVWIWGDGTPMPKGAPFWGRSPDVPSEPNGGIAENCAILNSGDGFFFHDQDCEESQGLSPLCQMSPANPGVCPAPYVPIYGSCFQFLSPLDSTWSDARFICQASAGDLAVLVNCNQMSAVIDYIRNGTTVDPEVGYWIGGTDSETEGFWKWIDGYNMPMGVPYWGQDGTGPLQPDDTTRTQNCAELWARDRYYFNDVECIPQAGRSPLCQANRL